MTNAKGPVLVIGATGQQGRATTLALLERGWEVHAFVRDVQAPAAVALQAQGANLVEGDLDDTASVRAAMQGAYGVFLMLTMMEGLHITADGIAAEQRRGKQVADSAKELGIAHLTYSSLRGAGQSTGIEYDAAEEAIETYICELKLPATLLRPTFFMDNLNSLNRPVLDENGELVVSLPVRVGTPISLISTHDIGAFAAIAFNRPERYLGRTVPLASGYLTPPQIAEVIGRHAGLPARSNQVPLEQVHAFDRHIAQMFEHFNGRPDGPLDIAELRAQHPGLLDLEAWLRTVGWKP